MSLAAEDLEELKEKFPELDWMKDKDWQQVATFADWDTWFDEESERCRSVDDDSCRIRARVILKLKKNRAQIRKDCRVYYGEENVPNINDPEDPTWA